MRRITIALSAALVALLGAGALTVVTRDDQAPALVENEHAAVTVAEGPRILADWLPNARWRYPAGPEAATDAAVVATIKDARLGQVTADDTSSASAPTQSALLIVEIERQLGGEPLDWSGDVAIEVTLPSSVDGDASGEALAAYRAIGRALFLLKTRDTKLVNAEAKALVYWDAGVAHDGRLVIPATGQPVPASITRGLGTIDDVERQAARPTHEVDPAERRRDPSYFEDTKG
jgi:hypothetical protein